MNQPTGPVQLPGLDAAFLGLERIRELAAAGASFAEAREQGVPEGQKVTGKRFEEEDK